MHSPNPELNPQVLAELHAQLEASRARLTALIAARRRTEGVGDTPDEDPSVDWSGDSADESVDLQTWDDTQQELIDLRQQFAAVERALAKFDNGTYGMGERSGQPIPLARLRLVPEARDIVAYEQ
jgi:DnaK suppressor protein